MKIKIKDVEKIIDKAHELNHSHIKFMPLEDTVWSGFQVKNGWKWYQIEDI